jgi:hypothetical protein
MTREQDTSAIDHMGILVKKEAAPKEGAACSDSVDVGNASSMEAEPNANVNQAVRQPLSSMASGLGTTLAADLITPMASDARKAMQTELAHLLERVEAVRRDLAELDRIDAQAERIAAKYTGRDSKPDDEPVRQRSKQDRKPKRKARAQKRSAGHQERPAIGTMAALIHQYRTNALSPYFGVRHATRKGYDSNLERIERDCGPEELAQIDEQRVRDLYEQWTKGGKHEATGYARLTMLRMIVAFGVTKLKDSECSRLSVIIRYLGKSPPKGRAARNLEPMTEDYAKRVIRKCLEIGRNSMALAQALQFECELYQKDVLGELVPLNDPEPSDVILGEEKWVRGIRWNQIDSNLILRHTRSLDSKEVEIDLKKHPLVMAELNKMMPLPRNSDPVIIDEDTRKPYLAWKFRRLWRTFATRVGVPKGVFNMDSRSNASDGDEDGDESDAEGSKAAS